MLHFTMAQSSDHLMAMLNEKIEFGENLIVQLEPIEEIDGIMKLQRKIRQETEFLKKLRRKKIVKAEQLSCSNLRHLGALVEYALKPGVVAVCRVFHMNDESKQVVDIISDEGKIWTKVIARNPKSLTAVLNGNASYGSRSILDQAEDYIECSKLYPVMYRPPKVVFEFVSGIEESLATTLKTVGVTVKGDILPDSNTYPECIDSSSESNCSELSDSDDSQENSLGTVLQCVDEHPDIFLLNLDVTAMMAYVSNMTNGHCNYIFKQDVLTQQSAWEAERPVKPILEKLFEGKELVCCRTAWNDFQKIIDTLGGPMEKERTEAFKQMVRVLPDEFEDDSEHRLNRLKVRGHVRIRAKIIFNFGYRIKAITVSANEGFVRAAKQQGITYAVFIHESRALTEGKESTATKITL